MESALALLKSVSHQCVLLLTDGTLRVQTRHLTQPGLLCLHHRSTETRVSFFSHSCQVWTVAMQLKLPLGNARRKEFHFRCCFVRPVGLKIMYLKRLGEKRRDRKRRGGFSYVFPGRHHLKTVLTTAWEYQAGTGCLSATAPELLAQDLISYPRWF